MSVGASGIFSAQAVIISLALHVVVVGGLYSLGTSGEKPPAADAPVPKSEVSEPVKSPVEKTEAEPTEMPKPKPDEPEIKKSETAIALVEKPKVKPENGPAQIRIEPRPDDKLESDVPVKKADAHEKNDDHAPAKNRTASGKTRVYVVKRGDTLTALAKECGLTVQELATLNGKSVKKLSNLWVGQKIKLPAVE